MKQLKENAKTETGTNDRSIVKSIRNTMIIGLPLTTVLSGVLAVGFAIALDGCSSKEKKPALTSSNQSSQQTGVTPQAAPMASPKPEVVAKKKRAGNKTK